MNKYRWSRPLPIIFLLYGAVFVGLADAQAPAASKSKPTDTGTQVFLPGEFTIPEGSSQLFYDVDNDTFTCRLIRTIKDGETIRVLASGKEKYSAETVSVISDGRQMRYPILALLTASNDSVRAFLPAILTAKKAIKAGTPVQTSEDKEKNAFVIQSNRDIKAGERIYVLFVNGPAILSVNSTRTADSAEDPWFKAFTSAATQERSREVLETWRIEMRHLR